jgi:hypothetical protein
MGKKNMGKLVGRERTGVKMAAVQTSLKRLKLQCRALHMEIN